jgi:hypothetical protein
MWRFDDDSISFHMQSPTYSNVIERKVLNTFSQILGHRIL